MEEGIARYRYYKEIENRVWKDIKKKQRKLWL